MPANGVEANAWVLVSEGPRSTTARPWQSDTLLLRARLSVNTGETVIFKSFQEYIKWTILSTHASVTLARPRCDVDTIVQMVSLDRICPPMGSHSPHTPAHRTFARFSHGHAVSGYVVMACALHCMATVTIAVQQLARPCATKQS